MEKSTSKAHLLKLETFYGRLARLTSSERRDFISRLTSDEVNFLSEIILNFLEGRIKVSIDILRKLSRLRPFLHKLASHSISTEKRRGLFISLKGLYTLAHLLPLVRKIYTSN